MERQSQSDNDHLYTTNADQLPGREAVGGESMWLLIFAIFFFLFIWPGPIASIFMIWLIYFSQNS